MTHEHCYYGNPRVCSGALWRCRTCDEWFCEEHQHNTSKGGNVECISCERDRLDKADTETEVIMAFNIGDTVRCIIGDMGVGVIVDTYINRHDDPDGIVTYIVEFERLRNGGERIFDRFAHEIKSHVEPVTVTIDKAEYDNLVARDEFLSCLEAAGVDSWEGYEEAQEM